MLTKEELKIIITEVKELHVQSDIFDECVLSTILGRSMIGWSEYLKLKKEILKEKK